MALFHVEVEPNRHLYHYTTLDGAIGHILPAGRFRFGLLANRTTQRVIEVVVRGDGKWSQER